MLTTLNSIMGHGSHKAVPGTLEHDMHYYSFTVETVSQFPSEQINEGPWERNLIPVVSSLLSFPNCIC